MALSILTMSRCPSPWATLSLCMMLSRPSMAKCFASSLRPSTTRKPINFYRKSCARCGDQPQVFENTYEQPFTGEVDPADLQNFVDKFVAAMDEDINAANGITVTSLNWQMDQLRTLQPRCQGGLGKDVRSLWSGLCRRSLGCGY